MEGETASISFKVSTTESTVWEFTDVVPSKAYNDIKIKDEEWLRAQSKILHIRIIHENITYLVELGFRSWCRPVLSVLLWVFGNGNGFDQSLAELVGAE